jgi:hypothetical protein
MKTGTPNYKMRGGGERDLDIIGKPLNNNTHILVYKPTTLNSRQGSTREWLTIYYKKE